MRIRRSVKMVCKQCGKELPEGTKFCVFCGTPCGEAAAPQAGNAAETPKTDEVQQAGAEAAREAEAFGKAAETAAAAEASGKAEPVSAAVTPGAAETSGPADAPKVTETSGEAVPAPAAAEAPKAAQTPVNNGEKPQGAGSGNAKKLAVIGAVAVAALVLLIVFCNLLFGSSPKKTFKAYVTGVYTCDFKKVWNNAITAKKAQKALDLYDKDDYEDDYEDTKDDCEDEKEDMKDDGIKYKLSIDIKSVKKIKKSDKEFEWAQDLMEDYFDCDADKIKQFAILEARVKAEYYEDGDRDKDYDIDTGRTQYLLVKIGGDWYMTGFTRDDIKDYLKTYYK